MLKPQLQKTLDEKWNNCWPVSDLKPLALLDLISYLFFLKKLDDLDLIHEKVKASELENFDYSNEIENFTWSNLQVLNGRQIQQLFNKEFGLIDLVNHYAHLDGLYSDYFKAPLLIEPTPKLLFNCIQIVNIIETSDKISRGDIAEYLFAKSKKTSEQKQEFLPGAIAKLIVDIAAPQKKDVIVDPSAGNGSLLITTYKYEEQITGDGIPASSALIGANLSGAESNLVNLRLAAMNMVLHGIKDPKIQMVPFGQENVNRKPSLIISSLIFPNETMSAVHATAGENRLEKEIIVLKEIIDHLASGGRAVILVPQTLLKSENPAVAKIRKTIVDHYQLEASITLGVKSNSIYSGAAILVFNKNDFKTTEDVWFYKWESRKENNGNNATGNIGADIFDMDEVNDILNTWKGRKDKRTHSTPNNFFIEANFIKNNKYHLNFNDYKLIRQQDVPDVAEDNDNLSSETILAVKKDSLHHFFDTSEVLPEIRKRRRPAPFIMILVLLVAGAAAFYWFYLKNNSHNFLGRNKMADTTSNKIISNSNLDTATTSNNNIEASDEKPPESKIKDARTAQTAMGATKYTVVNKAWFHYAPDSNKIKPLFLEPRKDIVLTPTAEENGFVYVVYVNGKGQSTHGWLSKKKLEAVE